MSERTTAQSVASHRRYVVATILNALKAAFDASYDRDRQFQNLKVTQNYPLKEIDYPCVVVEYVPRTNQNAGVGHEEWFVDAGGVYRKWHHSRFEGSVNFEIFAMTPLDRDILADALEEVIRFGRLDAQLLKFFTTIYGQPTDPVALIFNQLMFNADEVTTTGNTASLAPWSPEDLMVYQTGLSSEVHGGYYNVNPSDIHAFVTSIGLTAYTPDQADQVIELDLDRHWSPPFIWADSGTVVSKGLVTGTDSDTIGDISTMKQVNYYPSAAAWTNMWMNFNSTVIDTDFGVIKGLNANSVRIFVHPAAFGYPVPDPQMQAKLATVINLAAKYNLKVHLTLFDLFSNVTDITGSKQWAAAILAPYKNDTRISVVEARNEVDPTNAALMTWVEALMPYVKTLMPSQKHTISIADKGVAAFQSLVNQLSSIAPDFWSYHYYGPSANAVAIFSQLKTVAGSKQLYIGETGQSTYNQTDLNIQANYFTFIAEACAQVQLPPPSIWTLNDFTSTQGITPPAQLNYGLYRTDGTPKPSAASVRAAFA